MTVHACWQIVDIVHVSTVAYAPTLAGRTEASTTWYENTRLNAHSSHLAHGGVNDAALRLCQVLAAHRLLQKLQRVVHSPALPHGLKRHHHLGLHGLVGLTQRLTVLHTGGGGKGGRAAATATATSIRIYVHACTILRKLNLGARIICGLHGLVGLPQRLTVLRSVAAAAERPPTQLGQFIHALGEDTVSTHMYCALCNHHHYHY
jgi:hypothetical protein